MNNEMVRCRDAAKEYRDRLGWTVLTDGPLVWLVPGEPAEALNLPITLGRQVLNKLQGSGITPPVINLPGSPARWSILTQPCLEPGELLDLFDKRDVGYAHRRYLRGRPSEWGIDLPPSRHTGRAPLAWITSCESTLPQLSLVAKAIVAADTAER